MKFNRFFAAMAAVCFTPAVFGQVLPNYMTEQEKLIYPAYLQNIISKGFTTPPFSPVRSAAEWEESDGIVISWQGYNSVLTEIVRHARNECMVYIVCSDSASVKNYLNKKGVDINKLEAYGYGESRPIATNDTPEGRQKNRRVEMTITFR